MAKLIMCMGLPGSGKTTWAKEFVNQNPSFTRVNKDEIREELRKQGWTWSRENEKDVIDTRDTLIVAALSAGHSVISDDTNFGRKHKVRLEALARQFGAEFEIKKFPTALEECIKRDAQREGTAKVGEEVIRKMHKEHGHQVYGIEIPPAPVKRDGSLMSAIICDLDGTLSLFKEKGHRGPYDHSKCAEDDVNVPVKKIIEVFYRFMNWQIIYLSGREEKFREPTMEFLRKHHCPPGPLFMRPTGDRRQDCIVKRELFDDHVRGKYDVEFVLDDRNQVVVMWRRSLGLPTLQVNDGDF